MEDSRKKKIQYKKIATGIVALLIVLSTVFIIGEGKKKDSQKKNVMSGQQEVSINQVMEEIIVWKKRTMGIAPDQPLLQGEYLEMAGTSSADWFVFAMARFGAIDCYEVYQEALIQNIQARYEELGGLDLYKATEWHRIGLTLLAMGTNPININGINLVADGTYNRGRTMPLDTQGLNAYIWALILLDSYSYSVPENAYETREEIIEVILESQSETGSFDLVEGEENIDLTAMAIQSLAPYQAESKVQEAMERALEFLSERQTDAGDFGEKSLESSETAAQVLVALTALGINPETDERFIKSGNSVVDGLLQYRNEDGGFAHSKGSEESQSNDMASEQAFYALLSLERFLQGEGSLYQFKKA